MFEEEAEEYGHEHCCDSCKNLQARYRKVFKDGAEFGYKKGQSDQLVHKQYQLNQLRKANEWHYVKDGDLPKNGEKNILLYCKEHFCTTSYVTVGYFEEDVFYNDCDMEEDVIAWKEIVLPKEIKEK